MTHSQFTFKIKKMFRFLKNFELLTSISFPRGLVEINSYSITCIEHISFIKTEYNDSFLIKNDDSRAKTRAICSNTNYQMLMGSLINQMLLKVS